MVERLNRM